MGSQRSPPLRAQTWREEIVAVFLFSSNDIGGLFEYQFNGHFWELFCELVGGLNAKLLPGNDFCLCLPPMDPVLWLFNLVKFGHQSITSRVGTSFHRC